MDSFESLLNARDGENVWLTVDLPQVDLFLIFDLFISLERSERVIFERRSREGERERPKSKPTGQGRIIGKDC